MGPDYLAALLLGRQWHDNAAAQRYQALLDKPCLRLLLEPTDWQAVKDFASHYDQGRITRIIDRPSLGAQRARLPSTQIEARGRLVSYTHRRFAHQPDVTAADPCNRATRETGKEVGCHL